MHPTYNPLHLYIVMKPRLIFADCLPRQLKFKSTTSGWWLQQIFFFATCCCAKRYFFIIFSSLYI